MGVKSIFPWNMKRLMQNEVALGGRFEEFNYPAGPLSKFKIAQFHRELDNGTVCYGLGCGLDQKTAFLKAFYEFLERKAFFEHGVSQGFQTTNGIAIHKFQSLAARAALAELLERDAFLVHWYGQLPFQPIPKNCFSELSCQISQLRSMGYETVIARTVFGFQQTIVTFLVNANTSGFVVGTSSGKGLGADIEKSFVEACTNLFLVGAQDDDGSVERIKTKGIKSLRDHRAFWLFASGLPLWAFSGNAEYCAEAIELRLRPQFHVIALAPLPTVGVLDNNVLQLRVGPPISRDREILKKRVRYLEAKVPELNEMALHPIP